MDENKSAKHVEAKLDEWLSGLTGDVVGAVEHGVLAGGLALRDEAREKFEGNTQGYKTKSFLNGIALGKVQNVAGTIRAKVHALGRGLAGSKTQLAHLFAAGTQERTTRAGKYRGSIEALQPLDGLNEDVLTEKIKNELDKLK